MSPPNALTLVLVVALGAAETAAAPATGPAPTAAPAAAPAAGSEAGPAATGEANGAAPADGAAGPAVEEPLDPEVMGFLSLEASTASRDGGVKLPWDGPGGAQLRLSWDALDRRNEQLAMGDMMARSLVQTIRMFYENDGGLDPEGMRAKLVALTGAPMEEARTAYLDAVTWEERRLFFVERAIAEAKGGGVALPGVDAGLVDRRARAIRSGAVQKAMAARIDGYRGLALGLASYLEGDNFGALQRVRNASEALPDFSVAHAFLGSLYFLFDQKEAAVAAWKRAYELDPSNEAVKEALLEYGRTSKKEAPEKR